SGLVGSSTKSGLFFQDETHLVRWLETRKDIVLQTLDSIFSLPSVTSSQKTYLSDYTFSDKLNHASSSNFNYGNQQPEYELSNNNSLNHNGQQIELNSAQPDDDQRSYHRNNNYQGYSNQHTINGSLDNIDNQEFEDNLDNIN
ncbi:14476_t:CDS:2, partial [Cetraspora pellucida]